MVNLRIGSISSHLFSPSGKPEDSRSCVAKGLQYIYYGGTLGALALKPAGFCNIGVDAIVMSSWFQNSPIWDFFNVFCLQSITMEVACVITWIEEDF